MAFPIAASIDRQGQSNVVKIYYNNNTTQTASYFKGGFMAPADTLDLLDNAISINPNLTVLDHRVNNAFHVVQAFQVATHPIPATMAHS